MLLALDRPKLLHPMLGLSFCTHLLKPLQRLLRKLVFLAVLFQILDKLREHRLKLLQSDGHLVDRTWGIDSAERHESLRCDNLVRFGSSSCME